MSKLIFITSNKPINLIDFGMEPIIPNNYFDSHFPYIKDKKYIYDFQDFNYEVSYKAFIDHLSNIVTEGNAVSIIVLWETENKDEINEFNKKIKHKTIIDLKTNSDKIYDLIYQLEYDSLNPSSEYELIR